MENFEVCENCKQNSCDLCDDEWISTDGEEFFCACECRDFDSLDDEDNFYSKGEAWDKWGYEDDDGDWE